MKLNGIVKTIIKKELPLYSNLSNVAAILFTMKNINWAGFYLVENGRLCVGPYHGEIACGMIEIGKGVCGTSVKEKRTIIVPNVFEFQGHIACSTKSKSEIVVPIFKKEEVVGVIDIDAPIYDRFHEEEQEDLEEIARLLGELF